ncbi:hypothetical protein I551_5431 [Mycobacterium ulcerans str. Harvey]|uniref:Uncharacterized protein n=1 Tax=Mycobacterium ulcerans str. Harvey TaxID=1299332 RepID=A0ABN0QTH5_MYCUL|nr:hypothetical protein I551_5431 [Mycobacterium ulcerans str. Harvey]
MVRRCHDDPAGGPATVLRGRLRAATRRGRPPRVVIIGPVLAASPPPLRCAARALMIW